MQERNYQIQLAELVIIFFQKIYIRKLKRHFFLQIFQCLYEIFYIVYRLNILHKDILTAIIKSKLKYKRKKLKYTVFIVC